MEEFFIMAFKGTKGPGLIVLIISTVATLTPFIYGYIKLMQKLSNLLTRNTEKGA